MSSNEKRAAEVMAESAVRELGQDPVIIPYLTERILPRARALADAGLLAPELPRPDKNGHWWPAARQIGSIYRVRDYVVWTGFEGARHSIPAHHIPEFVRMLLAAADWAGQA